MIQELRKSSYCTCGKPEFNSKHLYDSLSWTIDCASVLEDPKPLPGFHGLHHIQGTYKLQQENKHTHKTKLHIHHETNFQNQCNTKI